MQDNIQSIAVYFDGYGQHRLVGRLLFDGRRPAFGYDATWLADGLPLSPIEMPLDTAQPQQLYYGEHAGSYYVCGLLADSLPDGWGLLLMDRFFRQKLGKQTHEINVLQRFAYIGDTAMGALTFEPEFHLNERADALDLLMLARANQAILAGQDSELLEQLILIGGSPQGARPKALVYYDTHSQTVSTQASATHVEPWLVKFPAQNEHKSVCLVESCYADYVKQAGIEMPPHRYIDINDEHGAFAVKRFDRANGQRVPIHTLAGLLNVDFRLPSLDYSQLLRCVRMLTRSQQQVEQAYRQAVFNVVFNNKDDHSKNFSFIMGEDGQWSLSPAYDITFNVGMNGYHQMDVSGNAKNPTANDLLKLASIADIKPKLAKQIIEHITTLAETWVRQLKEHPINPTLAEQIKTTVTQNINRMTQSN